ncbi:DNA (cytosine-5-)-methyltransferase [Tissierella sp. P1]|uniref:DNA cytosine methyltransferase n=1 Tax=Tissierella sp. P1 TaxID=1280483 RepID=UPI000BA0B8EE|nr:DNA (cytosine-5-)-methyltransferase [Tissierella sp. P1]OZV10764.1 DNA (cytosine-5-)-methyltransferase [Tissierella sp. P1]
MKLTHFSLFTGIGGIDLAAEWAGFETVGQCEYADFPTKVLEKHWPNIPRWRDVRDVTAKSVRERGIKNISLLSGGFPCQPHSVAGKREGSNDERDLWGEYARIISEITPKWVLGENVPGLLTTEDGRFFGGILNDLAEMGYNAGWCSYGAEWVDAPHKRERIFIVAHSNSFRSQGGQNSRSFYESREEREEQFERFYKALLFNSYSKSELQKDKEIKSIGEKRNKGQSNTGQYRREAPRTYWQVSEPPILGVDDGISNRVDRSIALGNAVVPQQVYPILKMIADIERGI